MRRFHGALKEKKPELHGERLNALCLNTPGNIPIAMPVEWTIYDVVDAFLNEVNSERIVFADNQELQHSMTVKSEYFRVDDQWVRKKTTISLNPQILHAPIWHESENQHYRGPTDTELAIVFLHEYSHPCQDQAILDAINGNECQECRLQGLENNQLMSAVKAKSQAQNHKAQERIKDIVPAIQRAKLENIIDQIDFREAQATGVLYLFLHQLNQLNRTKHFPGARLLDITNKADIQAVQAQYPSIYIQNWYDLFERRVITTRNALDLKWLVEISGFRFD